MFSPLGPCRYAVHVEGKTSSQTMYLDESFGEGARRFRYCYALEEQRHKQAKQAVANKGFLVMPTSRTLRLKDDNMTLIGSLFEGFGLGLSMSTLH